MRAGSNLGAAWSWLWRWARGQEEGRPEGSVSALDAQGGSCTIPDVCCPWSNVSAPSQLLKATLSLKAHNHQIILCCGKGMSSDIMQAPRILKLFEKAVLTVSSFICHL